MESRPRQGANGRVRVTVQEFAAKYSTKKEVYDFVSQDAGIYVPPKACVTIWHLRDLALGTKTMIKATDIQHLSVPFYESLSVEKMLAWVRNHQPAVISTFLPEEKEIHKLPRQYLINIFNTVIGEPFRAWVKQRVEARNEGLVKDNYIDMDPAVYQAFMNSTQVSIARGTAKNLMKVGAKRRRTKQELLDSRSEDMMRNEESTRLAEQLAEMQQRLNAAEAEKKDGDTAAQILRQWIADGKVAQASDGTCIINQPGQEPVDMMQGRQSFHVHSQAEYAVQGEQPVISASQKAFLDNHQDDPDFA